MQLLSRLKLARGGKNNIQSDYDDHDSNWKLIDDLIEDQIVAKMKIRWFLGLFKYIEIHESNNDVHEVLNQKIPNSANNKLNSYVTHWLGKHQRQVTICTW